MQTDTWLTETTHPDCCPLCSQPLPAGSNTCASCGFTAHEPARGSSASARASAGGARQPNPITPIPARASARRSRGASVHSVSSSSRSTPFFAPSSAEQAEGRRHESSNYEAVSSLSSLSLIISETPTAPPRTTTRLPRQTRHLEHIDEIDTVPQKPGARTSEADAAVAPGSLSLRFDDLGVPERALVPSGATLPASLTNIDEIDTVPEAGQDAARALQLVSAEKKAVPVDATSWTVGPRSTTSLAARFIASRAPARRRNRRRFSPLDRTRWWLLRPGHIEFLLWLSGSLLLFGITFLLLLSLVLSIMLPGLQAGGNFPRPAPTVASGAATPAVTAGLRLQLAGPTTLAAGAELHVQGQGFRPLSRITFWLDGRWPLLDQHGQPASVQADASGRFTVSLWLGQGANWSAGPHQILAREMDNGKQAAVSITIKPDSTTPVSNNAGPRSTPVAPVQPTQTRPTPTATPASPTATPVQSTPTAGITPTASPSGTRTPGTPTPTSTGGKAVNSTSLGNDLNTKGGDSLFARLLHLNPLIWFIGICYLLSMLLMGLAGVLRRRHR